MAPLIAIDNKMRGKATLAKRWEGSRILCVVDKADDSGSRPDAHQILAIVRPRTHRPESGAE